MEYRPRGVRIEDSGKLSKDDRESPDACGDDEEERSVRMRHPSENEVAEDQDPFMGMKVGRMTSLRGDYKGDYLDVVSHPFLVKIFQKQGDKGVLFADKVLKFTASGKMKRRILLITDFAIYIVDPDMNALKRRVALAAVDKMCLSKLTDNFFAIIIPTEYDLLMASSRKTEIVTVLVEATKSASDYQLEVVFSNRFEYHASSDMVKEVQFEEVEGMWHLTSYDNGRKPRIFYVDSNNFPFWALMVCPGKSE